MYKVTSATYIAGSLKQETCSLLQRLITYFTSDHVTNQQKHEGIISTTVISQIINDAIYMDIMVQQHKKIYSQYAGNDYLQVFSEY